MSWFFKPLGYYGSRGGETQPYPDVVGENTTADGEQVFAVIGDSNSAGRGTTITTVGAGILYNWNGASFDEITNESISDDGTSGSAWHQFAIDHNSNSGKKVLVVNGGIGGSNLYPTFSGDEHWMGPSAPQGVDLWTPYKADLDAALASKSLAKPKAVFIVGLGINDHAAGTSIANISAGLDAMITNITTAYPGVPILYTTTGVNNISQPHTVNYYNIRKLQIEKAESVDDLHICGSGASCVGAAMYKADQIHYETSGLNHFGSSYARWFKNLSVVSNKWARSIISSHFDDLSTERKGLIDAVMEELTTSGDYFKLDHWYRGKTTIQNNFYLDWTFLGNSQKIGTPSFTANTSIGTSGNTANVYTYNSYGHADSRGAQEDFIEFVELLTRSSTGQAAIFGADNADGGRWLEQNGSGVIDYKANDATTTSGPTQLLTANKYHAIARSGGTKMYLEDTNIVDSEAVASTTQGTHRCRVGARILSTGTTQSAMNGTYGTFGKASYSDFDYERFITLNRQISDNW